MCLERIVSLLINHSSRSMDFRRDTDSICCVSNRPSCIHSQKAIPKIDLKGCSVGVVVTLHLCTCEKYTNIYVAI